MLKKLLGGICIVAVLGLSPSARGSILLDKVMAIVNKEVITWSDLYKAMEFEATDAVKVMKDKERRNFFKENEGLFLETLIDMKLQLQEAARAGILTGNDDVDKAIQNIKTKYSMTDEAFQEALKKDGSSLSEYRKRLAEQITISRVVEQEVRSKVLATEAEIDAYLAGHNDFEKESEGYGISYIFLKSSDNVAQAQEKAKDIYGRIKAGEDFSQLARQYSEDPSARTGGDLGFIRKMDLSREFLKALSGMKIGDVSEPFGSDRGIHILKLNEERMYTSPREVREAVRQKLLDERFNREYRNWLKGLRERSYIEIRT